MLPDRSTYTPPHTAHRHQQQIRLNSVSTSNNNIIILMPLFIVLSSWQSHCGSSLGSFDECRLSTMRPPTITPSQPTWAVSPSVGCHHLHPPSLFIIITQPEGWYLFYRPTEGRKLSRPKVAGYISRWFIHPITNRAWRRATTLIKTNALPHITINYLANSTLN